MAILTAAEAREFLSGITGTGEDTILTTRIAAVSAAIARFLGFPPASGSADPTVESATYTCYSGGGAGVVDRESATSILLPVRPVISITSITDDPDLLTYAAGYLVASTDYQLDALDGRVRLLPSCAHGGWSSAPYALKVVFVGGWATPPADVKEAARICVQHLYGVRSRGTATNVTNHETTITPQNVHLPEEAKMLLAPLQIGHGWVA